MQGARTAAGQRGEGHRAPGRRWRGARGPRGQSSGVSVSRRLGDKKEIGLGKKKEEIETYSEERDLGAGVRQGQQAVVAVAHAIERRGNELEPPCLMLW